MMGPLRKRRMVLHLMVECPSTLEHGSHGEIHCTMHVCIQFTWSYCQLLKAINKTEAVP
jgi:hypothetical protein